MKDEGKERGSGYILRFGRVKHWINDLKRIELDLYCTAVSQIGKFQIFSKINPYSMTFQVIFKTQWCSNAYRHDPIGRPKKRCRWKILGF